MDETAEIQKDTVEAIIDLLKAACLWGLEFSMVYPVF